MWDELPLPHRDLLKKIAGNAGLGECDIDLSSGSVKGDNYLGIIKLVTLVDKTTKKKLHLVLKAAHTNKQLRAEVAIAEIYKRETFLYNTILPNFRQLEKQLGILEPFANYAKLYGTSLDDCNECIVLGNLRESGYRLWNRKEPMTSEHAVLVLRTYARFHSISLAYSKLYPDTFKELTKDITVTVFEQKVEVMDQWLASMKMQFETSVKIVEDNKVAKEALERFGGTFQDFMMDSMKNEKYKIVVTHGDCWCNNMMFKYGSPENPKKPTDVCLLDWQISSMGSPAYDLAYFLCASCSKQDLDKIDDYLQIYYETVAESLRNFGCDPDEVFPRTLLDEHWKKFSRFGIFVAMSLLKITLGEDEDAPDLEKLAESGKNVMMAIGQDMGSNDLHKQRLIDVILFMVEQNLI